MTGKALIVVAYDVPDFEYNANVALELAMKLIDLKEYEVHILGPAVHPLVNCLPPAEYKGEPTAWRIKDEIETWLSTANKVIYIDDHSTTIAGGFSFKIGNPNYNILYSEIDNKINTAGACEIIVRGNRSGDALTGLYKTGRKVFSSMEHDRDLGDEMDWYMISHHLNPSQTDIETAHDLEYNRLWTQLKRQEPKKQVT